MTPPRLTAEFWVTAYLRRLNLAGIPAFVARRGDAEAGSVLVKVADLAGSARAFLRFPDAGGGRSWQELEGGAEADVDEAIGRQKARDPDLWVIEIEDPAGRSLLDEPGL
jgi:hypothetical protein